MVVVQAQRTLFHLTAAAAIGGLVLGPIAPPHARAQNAPATPPDNAAATVDPPSRVGRLADVAGTVSFHTVEDTTWQAATQNYPVTSGNAFWTQPQASAAIEVGPTHLVLDQQTEFDVGTLDDHTLAATAPQGDMYLRLGDVQQSDVTSVTTPRGAITFTAAGRYEIVAGNAQQPTTLTVVEGAADIVLATVTLHVTPRQTASITGSADDAFQVSVGPQVTDPFLTAQLQKERPATTATYQPPPLVQNMTGYDAVRDSGEWAETPNYGHVWYPPVAQDWVPYRHGHWAFVAPWGWTWVDDAAWGFAPFHYGRWLEVNHRWGWIPSDPGMPGDMADARPVYAPALVSFVNVGEVAAGVAAGMALGAAVGWIPLGPREPYNPPFHASPAYVRNVNITHVANVTNTTNTNTTTVINNYANRSAATVVPAGAMTGSRPIAAAAQPVTPQVLAAVRPVAQPHVQPTAATVGYVPAAARAPAPAGATGAAAPVRPAAPGPAIVARPAAAAVTVKPATPAAVPAASSAPVVTHPATSAALPALKPATANPPTAPAQPATQAAPAHPSEAAPKTNAAPAVPPAKPPAEPTPKPATVKPPTAPAQPATQSAPAHPTEAAPKGNAAPPAQPAKPPAEPPPRAAPGPHPAPAAETHPAAPRPEKPKSCAGGQTNC
jgi:hypothetical protein